MLDASKATAPSKRDMGFTPNVLLFMTNPLCGTAESSGGFLPPSPPHQQARYTSDDTG